MVERLGNRCLFITFALALLIKLFFYMNSFIDTLVGSSEFSEFINNVKAFEGLRLKPYLCPSGLSTIGYGHVSSEYNKVESITAETANDLLFHDMMFCLLFVYNKFNRCVYAGQVCELSASQIMSLADLCFNIGPTSFIKSQNLNTAVRRYLYSPGEDELSRVCYVLSLFNKSRVDGKIKVLEGLVRRRSYDIELFRKGHSQVF